MKNDIKIMDKSQFFWQMSDENNATVIVSVFMVICFAYCLNLLYTYVASWQR